MFPSLAYLYPSYEPDIVTDLLALPSLLQASEEQVEGAGLFTEPNSQ